MSNKLNIDEIERLLDDGEDIEVLPNGDVIRKGKTTKEVITKKESLGDNY